MGVGAGGNGIQKSFRFGSRQDLTIHLRLGAREI
jgi:hypothetical protein